MKYLSPENDVFFLITRAALSLTSTLKKILAKNELPEVKPSYLGALMCLWAHASMDEMLSKLGMEDGMRLTDLAQCAGVEPSTITSLIDRMEKDKLVYRSHVPEDRRALKANLTEKGHAIHNSVQSALEEMAQEAFAGITPEEMESAKHFFRKVLENSGKRERYGR